MKTLLTCAGLCMLGAAGDRAPNAATPPELGDIRWLRGFDEAITAAAKSGRPLLVLFDEVPGCANCTGYGQRELSHPLLVEAAETLFTPVAVYNNVEGADRKTLDSFKEPAWNNPVVRIISADRMPLADRVTHDASLAGLTRAMVTALKKAGNAPPGYLELLAEESAARSGQVERAVVAMHCFWEGEAALGSLPGVVGTTAGFVRGEEVVEVEFDPRVLSYDQFLDKARQRKCTGRVYARTSEQAAAAAKKVGDQTVRSDEPIRPDAEPKYYLGRGPLRFVPMTPLQAARVNGALGTHGDPRAWLSPRQLELLKKIEQYPQAGWTSAIGAEDFRKAWRAAFAFAERL